MALLAQSPPSLLPTPTFAPQLPKTLTATARRRRLLLRPLRSIPFNSADLRAHSIPHATTPTPHLPAARTYSSPLASLTLVGPAAADQALTAAASDAGASADSHPSPTMVVNTVSPAAHDPHRSTVSTRLFLPSDKVKEKARKLRRSLTSSIELPHDILALTFRQVVIHGVWSFKLSLFEGEDVVDFSVSSSDVRLLSAVAEVVFAYAVGVTAGGHGWFRRERRIGSGDSSVCLCGISEGEVVECARRRVEEFELAKREMVKRKRGGGRLWTPPSYPKLDRAGGSEFSDWTNEFVPAYRLQIDGDMYKDADLEGWRKMDDGRCEVLLTHLQMVELANILDMYYEDQYTIPDKQLSCGLVTETSKISRTKHSPWKTLFVTIVGGCFLVSVSVLAQVCLPRLVKAGRASKQSSLLSSPVADCCVLQSLEATKLEAFCVSAIKTIKDDLNWPGNVTFDTNIGAWIGVLPSYLTDKDSNFENATSSTESAMSSIGEDPQRHDESSIERASHLGADNMGMPAAAQNIASYQVVFSGDGEIIGFQPTSRVAVNHWASNPLAKVLYKGQKLSPGLLEPSLKIPRPCEVILLELLMSLNPESYFALARAYK